MGDYLKDQYEDELYSVGFTAVQGKVGGWIGGKSKALKQPKKNSLEDQILQGYERSDYFLDLSNESDSALDLLVTHL